MHRVSLPLKQQLQHQRSQHGSVEHLCLCVRRCSLKSNSHASPRCLTMPARGLGKQMIGGFGESGCILGCVHESASRPARRCPLWPSLIVRMLTKIGPAPIDVFNGCFNRKEFQLQPTSCLQKCLHASSLNSRAGLSMSCTAKFSRKHKRSPLHSAVMVREHYVKPRH